VLKGKKSAAQVIMPVKALPLLLLLSALLLASCSTPHYKITLKDGREFMTASQPQYSAKTGYYRFRAPNGKDSLIRADEILMMAEQ
jgi:hypothetical protein